MAAGSEKPWTCRCRCRESLDTMMKVQGDVHGEGGHPGHVAGDEERPGHVHGEGGHLRHVAVEEERPGHVHGEGGHLGHVAGEEEHPGHIHGEGGYLRHVLGKGHRPAPAHVCTVAYCSHRRVCKDTIYQDIIGDSLINTHFYELSTNLGWTGRAQVGAGNLKRHFHNKKIRSSQLISIA